VTHAHLAQKHVTVCGEAASRSDLAIALLALDVDALSVSPAFIPELKHALASVPVGPLREAREDLLALSTTDAVTDVLARYAHNVAAPVVTPPPSRRSSSPRSPRTPSMRRWWSRGRSPRSS
jgi:signal transduction protein with GAF and PtsI domain